MRYSGDDLLQAVTNVHRGLGVNSESGFGPTVVEVMVHPGSAGALALSSGGWDAFNSSQDRLNELSVLTDPHVRARLEELSVFHQFSSVSIVFHHFSSFSIVFSGTG